MAQIDFDLEDLGRNIQDIVDRAVNSHDFQKLDHTIRQAVDKAANVSGSTVRKVVDSARTASRPQQKPPEVAQKKDLSLLYGKTNGITAGGIAKIIGGALLSAFGFLLFFSSLIFDILASGAVTLTFPILSTLVCLTGGGALIGSGVGNVYLVSRFKSYRKQLGQKTVCALETLARHVGKTEKFVLRDVQKMIRQGLFPEGHLDKERTRLITSHETFRQFEQDRLLLEQRMKEEALAKQRREANPPSAQLQEVLDKGDAFLTEIRRCNDAIPGVEISQKISRMETIVERIFDRAEAHPEVLPDLKKLMQYYLPMTVKLLNAYAEMDAQPVQGETILASKREIEAALDTLNQAFDKLLDDLFADTALDVSSDISVLQTLLAQEGLTDDGLKPKP